MNPCFSDSDPLSEEFDEFETTEDLSMEYGSMSRGAVLLRHMEGSVMRSRVDTSGYQADVSNTLHHSSCGFFQSQVQESVELSATTESRDPTVELTMAPDLDEGGGAWQAAQDPPMRPHSGYQGSVPEITTMSKYAEGGRTDPRSASIHVPDALAGKGEIAVAAVEVAADFHNFADAQRQVQDAEATEEQDETDVIVAAEDPTSMTVRCCPLFLTKFCSMFLELSLIHI